MVRMREMTNVPAITKSETNAASLASKLRPPSIDAKPTKRNVLANDDTTEMRMHCHGFTNAGDAGC
jgi:hypothetical protein